MPSCPSAAAVAFVILVGTSCTAQGALRPFGAACDTDGQCASGACTTHGDHDGCSATCAEPVALDGVCQHATDDGGDCAGTFRTGCEDGLVCALSFNNQIETESRCITPGAAGDRCDPQGTDCDNGLACAARCGRADDTHCTPVVDDGEVCRHFGFVCYGSGDVTNACRPGSECSAALASGDVACGPAGEEGDACAPPPDFAEGVEDGCVGDLFCDAATLACTALPTDADRAATPRDDVESEYVALLFTPQRWTADPAVYDRVARDLPAARAAFPDELDFQVDSADRAQNAFATCVNPNVDACAGTLTAVATIFGGRAEADASLAVGTMTWPGLFQPAKTQAFLDANPALRDAHAFPEDEEERPFVDVQALAVDGDATYRFMHLFGDCPEGCIDLDAYLVSVDVDGGAAIVDSYQNVPGSTCPTWIERCPPEDATRPP